MLFRRECEFFSKQLGVILFPLHSPKTEKEDVTILQDRYQLEIEMDLRRRKRNRLWKVVVGVLRAIGGRTSKLKGRGRRGGGERG